MDRMEGATSEYDFCGKIIGLGMKVHSALGPGFLESVYRNVLVMELRRADLAAELEKQIVVRYSG